MIGNKILSIVGGSTDAPAVEDGDRLMVETPVRTGDRMAPLQENYENLVSITPNLETSTEKLDENMETLQHTFLFRGFFRKKAREEQNR